MKHEANGNHARLRIGEVARGMLDGSVHYLAGAIELASLRHEVGAYENDPDFIAIVAVLSRIDRMSIDTSRQYWFKGVRGDDALEIQKAIEWAKEFSWSQCESLAQRYRPRPR